MRRRRSKCVCRRWSCIAARTIVPFKDGLELASCIDGARFVPLESANHLLLEDEPAWKRFVQELDAFLREVED